MKKFFLFAVGALALTACSNDETVEVNPGEAISFRPLVNKTTRATDITSTVLQASGFTVFATENGVNYAAGPYFPETPFAYSNGTYTSATKYYWPSTGQLDFYAYAFNGAANQVSHIAQSVAFTVTPDNAASYQTDLVFANTNGKQKGDAYTPSGGSASTYGAAGVPLNFRHAESKVTIKLKNSNSSLKFTVANVAIGYLKGTGTYTYSGSTDNAATPNLTTNTDGAGFLKFSDWTAQSGAKSYTQTATTTEYTSLTAATALPESFILIPQSLATATQYKSSAKDAEFEGAYISVQVKIQNTTSGAYIVGSDNYVTAMWPLTAITWNPGYHYTYTVDLADGGYYLVNQDETDEKLDPILGGAEIKFVDVTVDAWENKDILLTTAGSTHTINVANKYTGPYEFVVSGLTSGSTVAVTGTYNFSSPSLSTSEVPATGMVTITGTLTANTTDAVTSVITLTETGGRGTVTTISIVQAAAE